MPELNVREASKIVREYFDEIKKSRFIFDVVSADSDKDNDNWVISCEVSNVFDEEPRSYTVTIDDGSGEITAVREED